MLLNTPAATDGLVVLLNFTDLDGRDIAHVDPGFHITITKKSVPNYGDMLVWERTKFDDAISNGTMREEPPPLIAIRLKRLITQAVLLGFVSRESKRLITPKE